MDQINEHSDSDSDSWAGCSSMIVCYKPGSVVLASFEAVYLGACMWVPNR